MCPRYVPLLPHQATVGVPLDIVPHLHSVPNLFLQATDGARPGQAAPVSVQSQFKKEEDFVTEQPRFTEEKVDPVIFVQQEMEEGSVILS